MEIIKKQLGELTKEHFIAAYDALNEGGALLPRLSSGQLRLNVGSEYSQFIEEPSTNA
ncbi:MULTISPECIES: hypothetical protein [Aeromonas]|jgi:hypothetical protein|uniref:hypothetical protein n=1 Tax=Aeromonas TaxID=642 RepID=UPI00027878CE|nr:MULTISPECIES: hypothetical protein [Aeromonas]